jgi:hypothetical protein
MRMGTVMNLKVIIIIQSVVGLKSVVRMKAVGGRNLA